MFAKRGMISCLSRVKRKVFQESAQPFMSFIGVNIKKLEFNQKITMGEKIIIKDSRR